MLVGLTAIEAVGLGGGGGGGGGGGAAFFLQAPRTSRALSAAIRNSHFMVCFTLFLLRPESFAFQGQTKCIYYFQLQFGCVLCPVKVNCCTLLPSASMLQISRLPDRFD